MIISDILNSVVEFNKAAVVEHVTTAINNKISIDDILNKGLIAAMDVVGEKFTSGEIFVPEMLQAAKSMQLGLEVLKPHLAGDALMEKGTIIIGTVKGDLHDIGKNLVTMMVEGAGFNVVDLGVDVLVCGACLTHLHLMDSKAVGETTNMLDIVTSLQLADKVMNI